MLVVRSAQVATLAQGRYELYLDKATDLVAEHWPSILAASGRDDLRARVRRLSDEARGQGFETQEQWLRYVNVALALGDGFSQRPAFSAVLHGPLTPGEKIEELVALSRSELRKDGD
ncbi:hypothetical protein [Pyxidicoccus sp. MSG2]|uniref:hypothetical protein n=1 Tax=Pyxidicoccus sp. MSG2 TaxID=2996790 RepID=UPI002270F426|nr:hypothetical protein [Pyxidicoccus sp. MSG2]MCY1018178.1 hypothetical protein [Pyxidicoccus sp. MSG2]